MADNSIIIKKKKVVSHGGHHGGSWKVAYADFVTAMMAFFMVLWIMGLSDDTKTSIQGYFNDPMGFMRNSPRTKNVIQLKNVVRYTPRNTTAPGNGTGNFTGIATTDYDEAVVSKKSMEKAIASMEGIESLMKKVEIDITQEGIRIELLEDGGSVFFKSGSAILSEEGSRVVKLISPVIIKSKRKLVIEGHTDRKPYSGAGYTNWELSGDRASAMRRALAATGVPNSRFEAVRALADTQLRIDTKPFDSRNRRVSLLLPFKAPKLVEDLPAKSAKAIIGPKPIEIGPNSH